MAIAQNNPITASDVITALNGKADDPHNHDDRYYTESEFDSILNEVMPPIAAPGFIHSVDWEGGFVRITNHDARSVTFYYTVNDENVSKTNYEGFETIGPQKYQDILTSARQNDTVYIKGYIGDLISTPVHGELMTSGSN